MIATFFFRLQYSFAAVSDIFCQLAPAQMEEVLFIFFKEQEVAFNISLCIDNKKYDYDEKTPIAQKSVKGSGCLTGLDIISKKGNVCSEVITLRYALTMNWKRHPVGE